MPGDNTGTGSALDGQASGDRIDSGGAVFSQGHLQREPLVVADVTGLRDGVERTAHAV